MQPSTLPPTASRHLGGRLSGETPPSLPPPPPPPAVRPHAEKDASSHRDPSKEVVALPAEPAHRPAPRIVQESPQMSVRTLPRIDDGEGLSYGSGSCSRGPVPPTRQPSSESPNIPDSSGTFTPRHPAPRSTNPSVFPARYTPPPTEPTLSALAITSRVIALSVPLRTQYPDAQAGIDPRAVQLFPPPPAINQRYAAPLFSGAPVNPARRYASDRAKTVMPESTSGCLSAGTRVPGTGYIDSAPASSVSCPTGIPLQTSRRVLCVECTTNPEDRKHPFEVVVLKTSRRRGNVDTGWEKPESERQLAVCRSGRTTDGVVEVEEEEGGGGGARTRVPGTGYIDSAPASSVSCPASIPLQTSRRVLCVECTTNPEDRKHPFEVVVLKTRRRRGNVDAGWGRPESERQLGAGRTKPESERQLAVCRSGRTTDGVVEEEEEEGGGDGDAFGTGARQGDVMRHSSRKRRRDSETPPAPGAPRGTRVDEHESLPSSAEIRQLSDRKRPSGLFQNTIENFDARAQRRATDSPTITAGRADGARPAAQSRPRATVPPDRLHGDRLVRPGSGPPPPAVSIISGIEVTRPAATPTHESRPGPNRPLDTASNRPALVVFRSTTGPPSPEGRRSSQLAFDAVLANHERCGTARGADGLGSATEVNVRNFEEKRRVKTRAKRSLAASGKPE